MIAYKVFERRGDGSLISCGNMPGHMKYIYNEEGWNRPIFKGSSFFVFQNILDAYKLVNCSWGRDLVIWEVEVTDLRPIKRALSFWMSYSFSQGDIYKFWAAFNSTNEIFGDTGLVMPNCFVTSKLKLNKLIFNTL